MFLNAGVRKYISKITGFKQPLYREIRKALDFDKARQYQKELSKTLEMIE